MFSRIFIERPRFAMVISIVLTLAGAIAVFSLPISLYPEITPPEVVVSATYPGASAEVIAKTVGIPLEEEVNGVEDMLYMSSSSEDSRYSLTVTFKVGVDPDMAQVKVQNRIQQAQSKLPSDVTRQGLTIKRRSSDMLGFITVLSPKRTYDTQQLSDYVENNIKNSLSRVNGVGEVNIYDRIQSFKEDCDIYSILNRFANGDTSVLSQRVGSFGDYSDIPDNIHDFSKYISELSAKFDKLSPELKEAIQGDNLSKIQELIHKEVADILAKQNNVAVEKKEEVK